MRSVLSRHSTSASRVGSTSSSTRPSQADASNGVCEPAVHDADATPAAHSDSAPSAGEVLRPGRNCCRFERATAPPVWWTARPVSQPRNRRCRGRNLCCCCSAGASPNRPLRARRRACNISSQRTSRYLTEGDRLLAGPSFLQVLPTDPGASAEVANPCSAEICSTKELWSVRKRLLETDLASLGCDAQGLGCDAADGCRAVRLSQGSTPPLAGR